MGFTHGPSRPPVAVSTMAGIDERRHVAKSTMRFPKLTTHTRQSLRALVKRDHRTCTRSRLTLLLQSFLCSTKKDSGCMAGDFGSQGSQCTHCKSKIQDGNCGVHSSRSCQCAVDNVHRSCGCLHAFGNSSTLPSFSSLCCGRCGVSVCGAPCRPVHSAMGFHPSDCTRQGVSSPYGDIPPSIHRRLADSGSHFSSVLIPHSLHSAVDPFPGVLSPRRQVS